MICTLCLEHCLKFIDFSSKENNEERMMNVITKYFSFLKNKISANSNSVQICQNCWDVINNFHQFYLKVLCNNNMKYEEQITTEIGQREIKDPFQIKEEEKEIKSEVEEPDSINDSFSTQESNSESELSENVTKIKTKPSTKSEIPRKKYLGYTKIDPKHRVTAEESDKLIKSHCRLECDLCSSNLQNFSDLILHFQAKHKTKGFLNCCGERYSKKGMLVDHIKLHNDPNTFQCEICHKNFKNRNYLSLHKNSHEPGTIKCHYDNCNKLFSTNYKVLMHFRSVHGSQDDIEKGRTFQCPDCNKSFATEIKMKNHKYAAHDNELAICDICGKTLRNKMSLKEHRKTHGEEERIVCSICSTSLKIGYCYTKHMKRHKEEQEQQEFSCSHCGKKVANSDALRSHIRYMHQMERIHKCNFCEKSFKKEKNLKEHIATHGKAQTLYQCSVCMKNFNSNANMYNHRKKKHPIEWRESLQPKYAPRSKI